MPSYDSKIPRLASFRSNSLKSMEPKGVLTEKNVNEAAGNTNFGYTNFGYNDNLKKDKKSSFTGTTPSFKHSVTNSTLKHHASDPGFAIPSRSAKPNSNLSTNSVRPTMPSRLLPSAKKVKHDPKRSFSGIPVPSASVGYSNLSKIPRSKSTSFGKSTAGSEGGNINNGNVKYNKNNSLTTTFSAKQTRANSLGLNNRANSDNHTHSNTTTPKKTYPPLQIQEQQAGGSNSSRRGSMAGLDLPYYNDLNSLEFDKRLELQKLNKERDIKDKELSEIKSNAMVLMTNKGELEFELQKLEDAVFKYSQNIGHRQRDLENLDRLAQFKMDELQQKFELQLKELAILEEKETYKVQHHYNSKIEELKYDKMKQLEKEKAELSEEAESLQQQLNESDENLSLGLELREKQYKAKVKEIADKFEAAKGTITQQAYGLDDLIRETRQDIKKFEHELKNSTIKESQINIQFAKYSDITQKLQDDTLGLRKEIEALNQEFSDKENRIREIQNYITYSQQQQEKIKVQLIEEETSRRILHNKLQDLKGNIRVFCRVRPPKDPNEALQLEFPDELEEGSEIVMKNENIRNSNGPKFLQFNFDKVFQCTATNADIFEEISQLVQSALDGYNVCVFAYGQTGSGKTYTMSSKEDGMIPRAVKQIFESSVKLKEKGWEYQIFGQFLEIYNESLNDLLVNNNNNNNLTSPTKKKLDIRHDQVKEKTTITNLTEIELTSPKMVDDLLVKVNNNKAVAATKANEHSSRSHSIFRIIIKGQNKVTGEQCDGLLNLIDLAGSERLSHSQVTGHRLKETQAINKSLSCLGDVIYALGSSSSSSGSSSSSSGGNNGNSNHVPFRNSKLTYLLQYSLSGSSKTLMFVNVSPDAAHFGETVNSLRFAAKVNTAKVGRRPRQ